MANKITKTAYSVTVQEGMAKFKFVDSAATPCAGSAAYSALMEERDIDSAVSQADGGAVFRTIVPYAAVNFAIIEMTPNTEDAPADSNCKEVQ